MPKRKYTKRGIKAGMSKLPEYPTWNAMITRCYNPNDRKNYKDYGARGITVCDRWRFGEGNLSGFECFLKDMGNRPLGMSIDREDNNKGYSLDNCKWATPSQQQHNRGRQRNNTSGYIGVGWDRSKGMWQSRAKLKGVLLRIGNFEDKIDAALAYDAWVIEHRDSNATTNFPRGTIREMVIDSQTLLRQQ